MNCETKPREVFHNHRTIRHRLIRNICQEMACYFEKPCLEEFRSLPFLRDVICEGLATALLVSIQCALPLTWGTDSLGNVVQIALGMGFVVTVLIEVFGELGGAHMNPAVSISMTLAGQLSIVRGNHNYVEDLVTFHHAVPVIFTLSVLYTPSLPAVYEGGLPTMPHMYVLQGFFFHCYIHSILCNTYICKALIVSILYTGAVCQV